MSFSPDRTEEIPPDSAASSNVFSRLPSNAFQRSGKRPRGGGDGMSDSKHGDPERRTGKEDNVGPAVDPRSMPGFVPDDSSLKQLHNTGFRMYRRPEVMQLQDEDGNSVPVEEDVALFDEDDMEMDEPDGRETTDGRLAEKRQRVDEKGGSVGTNHTAPTPDERKARQRKGHLTKDAALTLEQQQAESDAAWFKEHTEGTGEDGGGGSDDEMSNAENKSHGEDFGRYLPMFQRIRKHHRQIEKDRKASLAFKPLASARVSPTHRVKCDGEKRYEKVISTYRHLAMKAGFRLERTQVQFIDEFIAACAPLVYGSDWHGHQVEWKRKHKRTKVHSQVMCLTPRRFGKTTSVTLFATALAMVIPGIRIVILSQNHRTSKLLLEACNRLMRSIPNGAARLGKDSASEMTIIPEEAVKLKLSAIERARHPQRSTITACPSTGDGT